MSKEEITPCQMYVDNEHKEPASPVTKAKYVTLEGGQTVESYMSNNINEVNIDAQTNSIELDESTFDSPVSMTIKGNTLQNILPEPSTDWLTHSKPEFNLNEGVRSQSVYDINAVDGDMVDLRIQGNTIKNLAFETSPIEFDVNDTDNFLTNQSDDTRYDIQDNYDYTVIKGKSVVNMLADTCGTPSKTVENEKDIIPDVNSSLPITTTDGLYHENILYGKTLKNELVPAGTEIEEIYGSKLYSDDLGIQVSDDTNMDMAVVKGKTLVNCVKENTQSADYTSFDQDYSGQSLSISGTSEGTIQNAVIKGQTLVNIAGINSTFVTMDASAASINLYITHNLQVGKTYAVIGEITEINAPNMGLCLWTSTDNANFYDHHKATTTGRFFFKDTITTKEISIYRLYIHGDDRDNGGSITLGNIMLIEYQEGMENWDIPYFQGMQSVKTPTVTTTGRNILTNDIPLNYVGDGSVTNMIKIKKGKTYTYSNNIAFTFDNRIAFRVFDDSGTLYDGSNFSEPPITIVRDLYFNAGSKCYTPNQSEEKADSCFTANINGYIRFGTFLYPSTDKQNQYFQLQLEESSTATTYEAYKSNTLTVNEEVTLRGIGDVCDTLDCRTGELTRRIGEVVLDGSESGWYVAQEKTNSIRFNCGLNISDGINWDLILADKVPYQNPSDNDEGIQMLGGVTPRVISISVLKSKLPSNDVDGLKSYLSNNNIRCNYVLADPTTSTVSTTITNQSNTTLSDIHAFNTTTHINTTSQGLIPKVSISKSVSYPAMLKPNTQYTIDLRQNSKPFTVNVGGSEVAFTASETRKTVTTPSTLTNETLSYYGIGAKANSLVLLEHQTGMENWDIPYFEGMKSVVNPKVVTYNSPMRFGKGGRL